MIHRARTALYESEVRGRYERRLVARMVEEGWLDKERGSWTGEWFFSTSAKAKARRRGVR